MLPLMAFVSVGLCRLLDVRRRPAFTPQFGGWEQAFPRDQPFLEAASMGGLTHLSQSTEKVGLARLLLRQDEKEK